MSIRLSSVDQSKFEQEFTIDEANEIAQWQEPDLFRADCFAAIARPILIRFANCAGRPERATCVAARPLPAGLRPASTAGGELLNERLHSSLLRFNTANRRKQSAR
jgi:hypothetical protein